MKTGFKKLDEAIDMSGGKLIVLGASAGMGKTSLGLNIIGNIATKEQEAVACFSLENSKDEIVKRLIASKAMVESQKVQNMYAEELTQDDFDRIQYGIEVLKDAKIFIDDTPAITVEEICEKARKLKLEQNIQFILIDYLELIGAKQEKESNKAIETETITKELKNLAEELNIPILLISCISSSKIKDRENKKLLLEDIKVENADIILLLYIKSTANITIVKNDSKTQEEVELAWMPEYFKFGNMQRILNNEIKEK